MGGVEPALALADVAVAHHEGESAEHAQAMHNAASLTALAVGAASLSLVAAPAASGIASLPDLAGRRLDGVRVQHVEHRLRVAVMAR